MVRVFRQLWLVPVVLLIFYVGVATTAHAAEPWYKLSGTTQIDGDVENFAVSPNSKYVVFTADRETDEIFDLYGVALDGGVPVRLSQLKASPSQPERIEFYAISPDSSRVVYVASQDEGGLLELYSVPIMGPASDVVKLNKTLPEGGDLWVFSISPDSKTVVYSADQDKEKTHEIYAVPIGGPASAGVKLNGDVVEGGSLYAFEISPDSKHVIYRGDQDAYDVSELYSVPITGGVEPIKLNKDLVLDGDVEGYEIDEESQFVVYSAYQDDANTKELYTVPIQGPATAGKKITPAMASGIWNFRLSANDQRVVYTAYQDSSTMLELYSVPVQGPSAKAVKLNQTLISDGFVFSYEISDDSTRVVYKAEQETSGQYDLYSVPIAGPASAGKKLNGNLAPGGDVKLYAISHDAAHVVYTAKFQDNSPTTELYSVPIAGPSGAGIKLNGPLINGGSAWYFEISPNAEDVTFLADAKAVDTDEVFTVPIIGPAEASARASGPMAAGGGATDMMFSPNSQHIVYMAKQESKTNTELYATGASTPNPADQEIYLPIALNAD